MEAGLPRLNAPRRVTFRRMYPRAPIAAFGAGVAQEADTMTHKIAMLLFRPRRVGSGHKRGGAGRALQRQCQSRVGRRGAHALLESRPRHHPDGLGVSVAVPAAGGVTSEDG